MTDLKYNDKHNPLLYRRHEEIKIYTGTTKKSKEKFDRRMRIYKSTLKAKLFTSLMPSTITVKGKFSHVDFNEEEIIDMLAAPTGNILKIGCNYGEILNESPPYKKPVEKKRTSNRGRKPKVKPVSKRKTQGTGKYFSSQITFEVYNPDVKKVYLLKLFRPGVFQAPGVKRPDMADLVNPIRTLQKYLQQEFVDESIRVKYFISVMRNYTCRLLDTKLLIRLNTLEVILKAQKDDKTIKQNAIRTLSSIFSENCVNIIDSYVHHYDSIGIGEIQHNCERYFGLIVKFYRPLPWKTNKRTTIKILRSGKINVDGGNSIEECFELYHWLENLFQNHADEILYNPDGDEIDSGDYSVGSASSIYDEDIEPVKKSKSKTSKSKAQQKKTSKSRKKKKT